MEIQFKKDELVQVLSKCSPFVSSKKLVTWASYFIFKDKFVYATNLMSSVIYKTDWDFGTGFSLPSEFYSLLNLTDSETCKVEVKEGNKLIFTSGSHKTSFNGVDLSSIYFLDEPEKYMSLPDSFIQDIKRVMFSMSVDATRPEFCGVQLFHDHLISSDTYRITSCKIEKALEFNSLIPSPLLALIEGYDEIPSGYGETQSHIFLKYNKFVVSSRKIQKEFPSDLALQKIAGMRDNESEYFEVDRAKLESALKRSTLFADQQTNKVSVVVVKDKMMINATKEQGQAVECLDVVGNVNEPMKFDVDVNRFTQAVNVSSKFKKVLSFLYCSNDKVQHSLGLLITK